MASVPQNFTVDLSGGYYMDPNTGQIVDSASGQTFSGADDLEGYAQTSAQEDAAQGSTGMSGALGGGSAISAAYLANQLAPGAATAGTAGTTAGTTAATTAGQTAASSAASAGTVSAGSNAGVLLSTGEVIPVGAAIPEGATAIGSAPLATGAGWSGGALSSLPGAAGVAAGAYTGYQQAMGAQNLIKDKKPSALQHAALFPITGGFDVLARPFIGNGKDKYQLARDRARKGQKEDGEIDDQYIARLSSGASHDFGKDGKHMLDNADGSQRHYYDVDWSREDSGQLAAMLDPIGLARGGSRKTGSDMTGNYVNLAQNAGNSLDNVREIYSRYDYGTLRSMVEQAKIDQADKDAMYNTLDDVYGVNAYAGKGSAFDRGGLSSSAPMAARPAQAPKPSAPQSPKPAVKPMTPGGVQLTQGPRPQPTGNFAGAKGAVEQARNLIPRLAKPRQLGISESPAPQMTKPAPRLTARPLTEDDKRAMMIPRLKNYMAARA